VLQHQPFSSLCDENRKAALLFDRETLQINSTVIAEVAFLKTTSKAHPSRMLSSFGLSEKALPRESFLRLPNPPSAALRASTDPVGRTPRVA
jgi:hypothetical protein